MIRTTINSILILLIVLTLFTPGMTGAALAQDVPAPKADYGDAPDSTNSVAQAMPAYPGVTANFPTAVQSGTAALLVPGPVHMNERLRYFLGYGISGEESADSGADNDGVNNLQPTLGEADQDGRDDGLAVPGELVHCAETTLQVAVTSVDIGQSYPDAVYVNVWIDFNRNGQWGEQMTCPGAGPSSEWAVQNQLVRLAAPGLQTITLPSFIAWNEQPGESMWLRVSVSEQPAPAADGSGPAKGYALGETEDYRLEGVMSPLPVTTTPALAINEFIAQALSKVHLPLIARPQVSGDPSDVAVPSGKLHEVDVVHLGGTGNPTKPLIVTVAGTGYAARLASWTVGDVNSTPTHLQDGPQILGSDHQLHVLTPATSPKLAQEMLISGRIENGTLWLTTWRVQNDGSFDELDMGGYGPNASVTVNRYAMAHRPLLLNANERRFQLVTPILHGNGVMRLITWQIDGVTGQINGRQDSGDVAVNAAADSDLVAIFNPGEGTLAPHYTVGYKSGATFATTLWDVTTGGAPSLRAINASGRDLRNNNNVFFGVQNLELAPLNHTGFVAASTATNGQLTMRTWENLVNSCVGPGDCQYVSSNISNNSVDTNGGQPGVQLALPTIITNRALLRDAAQENDLFTQNENVVQAIASVRKVMVTIVALDAVADGEVSLDDIVTVSAAAAAVNNTNASAMGLQEGEQISLRNLLYGNMMVSAGDATWAISEHVAGNLNNMITRMNNKAAELGMTNTTHCQAGTTFSSVSYSTARDQAILWESVYDDPLFLEFAGAASEEVCGTLPGNVEICHPAVPPMIKNMNRYPNHAGDKTGGGGGLCPSLPAFNGVPTCVGGGCLSMQVNRLSRPLIVAELQPQGQVANRWPDARTLFDYGYRLLFTPDFRGHSGNQGGTAADFALDYLTDGHAISVALTGDKQISLCNWSTDVNSSNVTRQQCTDRSFTTLAPGGIQIPSTKMDMVRISTLEADGDYLLGSLENNNLVLRLWRLGTKD